MAVVGAGTLARTFRALKSVWVSSADLGPRSWLAGLWPWDRGIMRAGRLRLLCRRVGSEDVVASLGRTELVRVPRRARRSWIEGGFMIGAFCS